MAPVRDRIIFKILLLTYQALNDQAPSCIKDLLKYKNSGRVLRPVLRSSNKHFLDEPATNLSDRHTPLLLQNCGVTIGH